MSFNGTKDKYKVQEVETVWKYFVNLKGARNQNNQLWKGESNRINKLTGGIAWKDKNLLQLRKRKFEYKYINDKNYRKVKDHCHYTSKYEGALYSIYNLKYGILKEIPVAFHSGLTYDYNFIIKKLAKEFEGEFNCLRENTEKNPNLFSSRNTRS